MIYIGGRMLFFSNWNWNNWNFTPLPGHRQEKSATIVHCCALLFDLVFYSPNFLRISLGIAFLLMRKSMVLAAMKALVMYQMPL